VLAEICRSLAKASPVTSDNGDEAHRLQQLGQRFSTLSLRKFANRASLSIVCHTQKQGRGTGIRHAFVGGEICFKAVGPVTSRENPHLAG
jgi:hypothetical protein